MTYTVSMIPYANMAPYRMLTRPTGVAFVEMVPSRSVVGLRSGEVMAAAVPVGALPALGDTVEMLGSFGIAAERAVDSVMLFSMLPLEQLRRPVALSLTTQSATSIRLLYLVLGYRNGFEQIPYVTEEGWGAAARLLIGDDALVRAKSGADPHVYDLATEWHRRHHRPFVFARWVIRRDAPASLRMTLAAWLQGLEGNDDRLILESAPAEAARIGLTTEEMVRYLRGMKRILGPEELEGQDIFLDELRRRVPERLFEPLPQTRSRACGRGAPPREVPGPTPPRIDGEEALALLTRVPLGELMERAHQARLARHPSDIVTYVRDTNPNYTNICTTRCRFCAFCREPDDEDAYTLSPTALAEKVRVAAAKGATTVLLQGGHNPNVLLSDWLAYIRAIREVCPDIHIHPFSPSEIRDMAEKEGCSAAAVLEALRSEGITTMPGGGAEILVASVREEIAPGKCPADSWLEIMAEAHALGMRTTATMMFGHVETDADIIAHLMALRAAQDRTGGFNSFIPWSFKPGNSRLSRSVSVPAHPAKYLRILATARLVLDNFAHIQSSWFSESERAGMLGLLAGADDFGGILVEENVLKTSGYERMTTEARVREMIRQAGFTPALRDARYRSLTLFRAGRGVRG